MTLWSQAPRLVSPMTCGVGNSRSQRAASAPSATSSGSRLVSPCPVAGEFRRFRHSSGPENPLGGDKIHVSPYSSLSELTAADEESAAASSSFSDDDDSRLLSDKLFSDDAAGHGTVDTFDINMRRRIRAAIYGTR